MHVIKEFQSIPLIPEFWITFSIEPTYGLSVTPIAPNHVEIVTVQIPDVTTCDSNENESLLCNFINKTINISKPFSLMKWLVLEILQTSEKWQ